MYRTVLRMCDSVAQFQNCVLYSKSVQYYLALHGDLCSTHIVYSRAITLLYEAQLRVAVTMF